MELESPSKVHYLAHRAVIRGQLETTKVRIVFETSCKEAKNGVSLNDCLHVGPPVTTLPFDILLRFRQYKTCLIGDTEKTFLNIGVTETDRNCLRFLRTSDNRADKPIMQVYRYNTVAFVVNSSPFLLNTVLRQHVESLKATDPEFVSKLTESFYVGGILSVSESKRQT